MITGVAHDPQSMDEANEKPKPYSSTLIQWIDLGQMDEKIKSIEVDMAKPQQAIVSYLDTAVNNPIRIKQD